MNVISNSHAKYVLQFLCREMGSILKKLWQWSGIKTIGLMTEGALKIPPVFHAISDTSVESLQSLILGATSLLLSSVGNEFKMKLTEVETLCSELRKPFAFVANTYTFNLGGFGSFFTNSDCPDQ